MSPEHEKHLQSNYPLLYAEPFLICDGYFRCDDGWFNIIDRASAKLEKLIAGESKECQDDYRAVQVKEKLAGLRIYLNGCPTDEMNIVIGDAEMEAMEICEVCSRLGHQRSRGYWLKTLCDSCFEKWVIK